MVKFKLIYRAFPELEQFKDNLPDNVCWGFTILNEQGCFVLIDKDATEQQQAFTLRHELAHLALDHLEQTKPMAAIDSYGDDMFGDGWIDREREADQYAANMTDAEFARLMQYAELSCQPG